MSLRKCKTCKEVISDFPCRKRVYCSQQCAVKRLFKNQYSLGRKHSSKELGKMKKAMAGKHAGKNNPNWKGKNVKYQALHQWVRRHLGTPQKCEGKNCNGKSKRYHWANRSGKYKRSLSDWVRLCVSCHSKLDWSRADKKELRKQRSKQMSGNKHASKEK